MSKKKAAKAGEWRDVVVDNEEWAVFGRYVSVRSTASSPLVIDPHKGGQATLYDVAGNAYIDFGMLGTDNFGYGPQRIGRVLEKLKDLAVPLVPEHDIHNTLGIRAKTKLIDLTPLISHGIVYGARSGSDANEVVLDALIRARPDRRVFGRFQRSFHGRNTGIRSFLDNVQGKQKWERVKNYPVPYQTIALPFPSTSLKNPARALRESFDRLDQSWFKRMNGFFFEIVQGEGGVNIADPEAISFLVGELRKDNIAIVVDEIQTGMGRTGTLWAYEQYGILPDIVTVGKSLGGGIADIAAVVMSERWNFTEFGARASTYGFEPIKALAVLSALEELERDHLPARARTIGGIITTRLKEMAASSPIIREIRGLGAMCAVEFVSASLRDRVLEKALCYGLILHPCGYPEENPSIRIMPPLTIPIRQLRQGLNIFEQSLTE